MLPVSPLLFWHSLLCLSMALSQERWSYSRAGMSKSTNKTPVLDGLQRCLAEVGKASLVVGEILETRHDSAFAEVMNGRGRVRMPHKSPFPTPVRTAWHLFGR